MITADFAAASSLARSALERASPTNTISGSSRRTSSVAASRISANDAERGRPTATTPRSNASARSVSSALAGSIWRMSMFSSPDSSEPICSSSSPPEAISAILRVGAPEIRSSLPSAAVEAGVVDRIVDERGRAGAEAVQADRAVTDERDREMARVGMLLELPEHRLEPGQVAGEHDSARAVLAGQAERRARAPREDRLRPARTDGLDHRLRAVRVGVDHEHDPVTALELVDLVRELILDRQCGNVVEAPESRSPGRRCSL